MIHSIALLGFPQHEQHVLGIFFKLTVRREQTYEITADTAEAEVLLVNADNDSQLKWVLQARSPGQKILLVGKKGAISGWPTVQKPYSMLTLVEQLDRLFVVSAQQTPAVLAVTQPPTTPLVNPAQSTRSAMSSIIARYGSSVRQGTGTAPVTGKPATSHAASSFLGLTEEANASHRASSYDDILVVDDSDIALKFMQKLLTRFGFRAELAKSGEDALMLNSKNKYKFIFIDVMMDGMDGYQTCRAIKQRDYADGKPPVVVMLSARGASLDKMRGSLAGCDAYLTKPLEEHTLLQTLSKYDTQVQRGFQDTNVGSSELHQFRSSN